MKSKILVLGSSSFSGASMVRYLLDKNEYRIYGTYRRRKNSAYLPYKWSKNFKFFKEFKIDLSNNSNQLLKLITKIKPKYIIDFASICMVNESWKNPKIYFKTNVLSKIKMVEYLSQSYFLKKYIYISTPEVFGSSKNSITEKHCTFNPSTPYATSKLSAEILLKNYFNHYKLPLIISRFSNFYGPGQPLYRLIPKIIACIDAKNKFPIQGNGKSIRNFIFSNDFCDGINKILIRGKVGRTYHFSGNSFDSVLDTIKLVCDLKAYNIKKLIRKIKSRIGHDLIYKLNSKKTRKELKWKPIYTLKKGLKEIIIYHRKYFKNVPEKSLIYVDTSLKK